MNYAVSEQRDPSDREERARTLRLERVEARLRLITEELDDVITESEGGVLTYASPNVERLLGLPPNEIVGRRFEEFIHPGDLEELAAGMPSGTDDTDDTDGRRTYRVRSSDGGWRWVEARGRAYRLPDGQLRFASVTRDMSAERDAERRFRLLERHGQDVISEIDETGRIRWASPNHEQILGYHPEDLVGRRVLDVIHPDETQAVEKMLSAAPGRSMTITTRVLHQQGGFRWMECAGHSHPGPRGQPASVWVGRDVTEKLGVQNELLEARTRAEDLAKDLERYREREHAEIARDVHDELGQGLTGLALGLDGLVAEEDLPESARERVRRMLGEVERVDDSLRRILSRLWPAALAFGLAAAIETYARELAGPSHWDLQLALDPRNLDLDRERQAAIFRIAQEALTNAARHADARHVRVELRIDEIQLHLTVADDGRGIEKDLPRSGHHGIAGMRERARAWGGRLSIDDASPGTRIQVALPL